MSEERKFKIISIPDEITLNKNNIYEFEVIPSDEFLKKMEYDGIPIRLVNLQKVEQLENIINEAKEECKSVIEDSEHTTISEFNINGLMRTILNILNKGSE